MTTRASGLAFKLRRRIQGAPGLLDRWGPPPPRPAGSDVEFSVLFVCHGNICRSPMAEEIMRRKLAARGLLGRVVVASRGTECAAPGRRPDLRARDCVRRRQGNMRDLRAARFAVEDFDRFDLILVMDERNHGDVSLLARDERDRERVRLLGSFRAGGGAIADPVELGPAAFAHAYDGIEEACDGLMDHLRSELGSATGGRVA